MFCCTLLYVHFSIAIILMGKRELIALFNLSSWCLVMVERLFLTVPRGCLQFVIVVFPDHTHLLFFTIFDIQKETKTEMSVKRLRELLNNYIQAMETAEQLSYSGKTEDSNEPLFSSPFNKSRTLQNQNIYHHYKLQCIYYTGNHWSDQCKDFPTAEDRKHKIKDSCYLCLRKGHTVFKCQRNKQCIHCGHLNYHHRSRCPREFPKTLTPI